MNRSKKNKSGGKDKKHRNKQRPVKNVQAGGNEETVEGQEEEKENLPYTIEISDVMGRYLVAAKELRPGELLISELPLVVGPCQGCKPLCLGCYKRLGEDDDEEYRCKLCGWPLCGPSCPGLNQQHGHSTAECALYAKAGTRTHLPEHVTDPEMRPLYLAVVPLRCLLLKTSDPAKWRTLLTMESHNETRRKLPNIWESNQSNVVDRIRKTWGMNQFSEDEIHTICGILEVNAFEVGQHGVSVRSLFPSAFLLAHDCVPNTCHTDDDNYRITVRASRTIKRGEAITLTYAYTMQGTMKRRVHLKESKFFDCCCGRCSDPTELGTFAGALKCPKCSPGCVISTTPLDNEAPWKCNKCEYSIEAHSVELLMERINDEIEAIDVNDIEQYEAFLKKYCNVLHSNHYHLLGVKHSLSQLYGKIEGYTINEMSATMLERKRDICREVLKVFDVLEPGYSRLRGTSLYELHAPIMILATRGFEARTISKRDLAQQLKEVVKLLEESSSILSLEPDYSSEGMMCAAAKDALVRMRDWQSIIGKI